LQKRQVKNSLPCLFWPTLADARTEADKARKLAVQGEHLTIVKRAERIKRHADAAATFGRFAEAWMVLLNSIC